MSGGGRRLVGWYCQAHDAMGMAGDGSYEAHVRDVVCTASVRDLYEPTERDDDDGLVERLRREATVVEPVPLPLRTWPENRYPTPDEAAEWVGSMGPEQLRRWCADNLETSQQAARCFLQNHEHRIARLAHEVAEAREYAGRVTLAESRAVAERDEARGAAETWRARAYAEAGLPGQESDEPLPWEPQPQPSS